MRCMRAHSFKLRLLIQIKRGSAMRCWTHAAVLLVMISVLGRTQTRFVRNALIRPYQAKPVPPVDFQNSERIFDLMRAGQLYISLEVAAGVALVKHLLIELA